MSDWSAGYVADIGYTYGYYTELNPLRIKLAFLKAGLAMPDVGSACELGYGQGLSANIHAAASTTDWHGTDFNPSQAAFAQNLSQLSGNGAQLEDDDFDSFAKRKDLPEFDYIGIHGIWSWISDENRATLVDFIRRKLKVGGVLYISYNTQPGWAAFSPMQHLMSEHAEVLAAEGSGTISRVESAIEFAEKLLNTNPLYTQANPVVAQRIKQLKDQNRQYLAHEYFNRDWCPMPFADMAAWLTPAKLQFACSAHFQDHIDSINLSTEQQTLLKEIPDPLFRQSVRDFMVNQQFRKDYWVKGARTLGSFDLVDQLAQTTVILTSHPDKINLKMSGPQGDVEMSEAVYRPIIALLADYCPKTLAELQYSLVEQGINLPQLLEAALLLAGNGHLALVQDDQTIDKAKPQSDSLNTQLLSLARNSDDIRYLASPVTGGGIHAHRFEQLFLLALKSGHAHPQNWAEFVWQILSLQGQKLVKDGKTLTTAEENLNELVHQASVFSDTRLPIFKALQIID